ncbi:hypothetical protein DM02DRAFT_648667 [Periconia macrospinosa]|uniref:THO complex subunit 2 n=1 Tax=Periconia macrospinosa TaxID=97972 RepID=A0A2V1EAG0_9PLEO|nr:hypothetical protein DM02DRAFT_648667 [Periconia macrospinosa]
MAPGPKRKRGDGRNFSQDDDTPNRPSPHRPHNLSHGREPQNNSPRNNNFNNARRGSRNSGRGSFNGPQSPSVPHHPPTAASTPSAPVNRPALAPPSTPIQQKEVAINKPAPNFDVVNTYEYLTSGRMQNWNAEAHNAVVQVAATAQADGDSFITASVFTEIVESSIGNYMDQHALGTLVRDIVNSPSVDYVDSPMLFLDCISTETERFSDAKGNLIRNCEKEFGYLRSMLIHTDISLDKMRALLESAPLRGLGLVGEHFNKVSVRKATDALYRQANYNLLREDSEGFSKLITEYFTTVNNEPPTSAVVSQTYQRVNAFIGTFDLDVGRVLDITLDVLANLLVKHGKFFVKLLRVSAWWPKLQGTEGVEWEEPEVQTLPLWALPDHNDWRYTEEEKAYQLECRENRDKNFWARVADQERQRSGLGLKVFFELGARRITKNHRSSDNSSTGSSESLPKNEAQQWADEWIAATGTLPPQGNDIAAQLLGFKFQFYASDTRDAGDVLPDNLIYLAALLIKIGFISIMDLYPHLYPADEAMPELRKKLEEEQKEKEMSLRGKSNALLRAGALPDDTLPPAVARLREAESKAASSKTESERSTPTKSDDDTSNSLPEPVNQKVALVRSLLCIGAIPEALFIIGRFPWLLDLYPDLHTYIFRLAHHSLSKIYDDSRPIPLDTIPSTSKGADSITLSRPGDYVPRRTLRWAKPDQKDAGDGVDYRFYWEDWVDSVPVCQTVDDVFLLCSTLLGLIGAECGRDTMLMTKLVRIGKKSVIEDPSLENTKRWTDLSAVLLAPALTFTGRNPGVANETWDLLKRFDTPTRYSIYRSWFRATKPALRNAFKKVTDDTKRLLGRVAATNTRPMGRAMAKLACAAPGTVFEHTLKQGQSYINMIDALVECSRYLTHLGYDCLTWTLVDSLIKDDRETLQGDGMLVKGWLKNTSIFIGKVYKRYSLMDPTPVLQLVKHQVFRPEGELYMLFVLEQLLTSMGGIGLTGALTEARVIALSAGPRLRAYTLEHHLGDKRHEGKAASKRLLRCLKDAGLAPQILVALARQVDTYLFRKQLEDVPDKVVFTNFDKLRANLAQFIDFLRENIPVEEFDEEVPNVVELMADYGLEPNLAFQISRASIASKLGTNVANDGSSADDSTANGNVVMSDAEQTAPSNTSATDAATPNEDDQGLQVNPHIEAIAEQLKTSLPNNYQNHPFLNYFVTFWSLGLINVRSLEQNDLKQQYEDAKTQMMKRNSGYHQRQAREDCAKLDAEYDALVKSIQLTQSRLSREMQQWFEGVSMTGQAAENLHDRLLQDCFFPRLRMSLQDAHYSSAMLFFMHRTGVPIFRLSKFLDKLFNANKISNMILMMSEEEAKYFGRFLHDILKELQRWHQDKNLYEKHAFGEQKQLCGFGRSFNPDKTPSSFIDHDQFRILHYKWHAALFNALKTSLKDGQYTELYNSINILKAVSSAFPRVETMATELRQIVETYAKNDDRDDIKVAANSLLYEFKRSAKLLKSESFFRTGVDPVVNKTTVPSRTTSEQPKTPQPPETAAKKLNATVPSFRPQTPEVNGQPKSTPEKSSSDEQKPPATSTTTSTVPRLNGREPNKVAPSPSEANATRLGSGRTTNRPPLMNNPSTQSTNAGPMRPDARSANQTPIGNNRATHALPTRPDAQPPRGRQPERPNDRTAEYNTGHPRHEIRPTPVSDYGRLDRGTDGMREREVSPGRRRSRSPHRGSGVPDRREWMQRDPREYEERPLRPPPRETRGPPTRSAPYGESARDPRDVRDPREYREREPLRDRPDPRGMPHTPHSLGPDGRGRMHSSPIMTNDGLPPRREPPSNAHPGDRGGAPPLRSSVNATPVTDRSLINPERAALMNDDRSRHDALRHDREPRREDRDGRRDRGSRPQSPRRDERPPPPPYHGSEARRDYRDERPQPHGASRDRRDEASGNPPTGPRSGRDVPAPSPVSRDIFQPSQPSRPRAHPSQDPNYGRLNQPADSGPPSGPRHPASDRRDGQQHTPTGAPSLPASAGIHPSRMNIINSGRGPPIQTDLPSNPPMGPRSSGRGQAPPLPSPTSRNPPTGPASNERGPRHSESRNALRTINNVLTGSGQNQQGPPPSSTERPTERSSRRSDPSRRERSRSREERPRGDKRDGSRREGREPREPRELREPREGRDRGEHRERRGDDRDRRSRGGEDMRERSDKKRGREGPDPPHGDSKRSRR